jgi:glycine/D-amino acid oxidase-like deaminating enzyme
LQEKVKYLIIGQGLVGTWMSYYLAENGIDFKIINDVKSPAATSVASGVINPVTGRRIVQTWMIETILPFAVNAYESIEQIIGKTILKKAPVIAIHPSAQMQESFAYRLEHDNVYLYKMDVKQLANFFKTPFGIGGIDQCYWLDLNTLLSAWRAHLIERGNYIESHFEQSELTILEQGVRWKNMEAEKIIFCDGINSMHHSFFQQLPFAPNKGEALIVRIPGLPANHIYKQQISIVPWADDLFWVGSIYEWDFANILPTESFKQKMMAALDQYLLLPYEIVDHIVGIRPANTQRRPFVGLHPQFPQIAICNGMGTKGCSLAPYFSDQLVQHMEQGATITPEASIERFAHLLIE